MFFSAWAMVAAFGTYFCMYGFRKPFTSATFDGLTSFGLAYKSLAVTSQVLGYTLSKFIGIKVIPELPPARRASTILWLIAGGELALVVFALLPPPYNLAALFLNGLALGMVFGLVLGFLEGRRVTEALIAGLCASFILASGVSKSVGRWLISLDVPEVWMPCVAGALFILPLLGFVWMLRRIPDASEADRSERAERSTMSRTERSQYFRKFAPGICLLIMVYVMLTVIRGIRDDFGVEIWQALGHTGKPGVFTSSETWVMFGVLAITGSTISMRDNRKAFFVSMVASGAGLLLILFICIAVLKGGLDAYWFMVWLGLGLYVPYVMFHTTVFERLVALLKDKATIGYLMYLADAFGYLGYVMLMMSRGSIAARADLLDFFLQLTFTLTLVAIVLLVTATCYFNRRH